MPWTRNCLVTAAMLLSATLISIVVTPSGASAQRPADASPELIEAILRHAYRFEGGNVRVVNGRAPEDIANFYVPPGTRVLGSVVYGSSVRVFATTTSPVDSLRELYTRALAPSGWRPFSWESNRGGFVDARRDMPIIFCRDGAQLQIQRQSGAGGVHDLILDFRDGMGPCERTPGVGTATGWASTTVTGVRSSGALVEGHMMERPRFPTLYPPDEANASGRPRCYSAGGSGRGSMSTGTMIAAPMTAAELLRHYAKQLEAGGWRPFASAGREAAVGTWTLADSSGVKDLTLQVVESSRTARGCFDVQMKMSEQSR